MLVSIRSNIGRRRASNQDYADSFMNAHKQSLFVLCDGIGGHQSGDVASELTTNYIGKKFEESELLNSEHARGWLETVIRETNDKVYQTSKTREDYQGMSTTLVVALPLEDGIHIAHVGDSRAYAYKNESLVQLTEDHSLVNELIKSGEITPAQGDIHPQRNVITESIGGTSSVSITFNFISYDEVDTLMLCSDGLTNMVTLKELTQFFKTYDELNALNDVLIDAANDAGGIDNITIILVSRFSQSAPSHGGEIHG